MVITYKTELSELINVGEVSAKTSEITKIIDEYADKVEESIKSECTSNLSEETFYIDNDPLIYNKLNTLIVSSEIDKSALSNIVSLAQEKREEELSKLHKAVLEHIGELTDQKNDKCLQRSRLELFNFLNRNASAIESLTQQIIAIEEEIKIYEEKLKTIESQMGGI